MSDQTNQLPAFPVESLGPDEFGDGDFRHIPSDLKWLVYWYQIGIYDGDGTAAWENADGTFGWTDLSHCSCYGPTGDYGENRFDMKQDRDSVMRDLATVPADYDHKWRLPVYEAFVRKTGGMA